VDQSLEKIAAQYRTSRSSAQPLQDALRELYNHYVKGKEQSLLDATAAAAAVNALFLTDQIDHSTLTPQLAEAFRLAYPNVELSSLQGRNPSEIEGFVNAWKGKYFEVLVRDRLNAGESVGDIHLGVGQTATLAESATQPGWDMQILEQDGAVADALQLKATQSLGYVKAALRRYPDINILTTDEVLAAGSTALSDAFPSGFSESDLNDAVRAPLEALLDSTLEEVVETVLPELPFVLIATREGSKVLMGRKSFEAALQDSLWAATKTGAAIGVGALIVFLDGGLLSIPGTFLTRVGFDRYNNMHRAIAAMDQRINVLRSLTNAPGTLPNI
jgi:hypothetical protein